MTFRLAAPFPAIQTFSHLPNPEFGDFEAALQGMDPKRSINNTRYTYVKRRNQRRRLSYTFNLTQAKAFEVMEFVRSYQATKLQIVDHLNQKWIGYFTTNPNEVESQALGINNAEIMYGHATITLVFEAEPQ